MHWLLIKTQCWEFLWENRKQLRHHCLFYYFFLAGPITTPLNRQMVVLLVARGLPKDYLLNLVDEEIKGTLIDIQDSNIGRKRAYRLVRHYTPTADRQKVFGNKYSKWLKYFTFKLPSCAMPCPFCHCSSSLFSKSPFLHSYYFFSFFTPHLIFPTLEFSFILIITCPSVLKHLHLYLHL